LCEDIAKKIGTIGYMKELNRTKVGRFEIRNSITIEELENNKEEILQKNIITMEELLQDKKKIIIKNNDLQKFLNGVKLKYDLKDDIYQIYDEKDIYLGTAIVENKKLKRDIIL